MNRRLLECAVKGHDFPDQSGAAFRYAVTVTCKVIAPHDIENTTTTKPARLCARCDCLVAMT